MKTGPFRSKVLTQPLMYLPLLVCGSAANNFSDAGSIKYTPAAHSAYLLACLSNPLPACALLCVDELFNVAIIFSVIYVS